MSACTLSRSASLPAARSGARRSRHRARAQPCSGAAAGAGAGGLLAAPGDPSLVLLTSVTMEKEAKREFMRAATVLIAESLGKPQSYVAVAVQDGADVMWAGEECACALGNLYSLGAIGLESNEKVSAGLCELLGEFGVPADRYYINFWDIGPRENCGYNGKTFGSSA